MTIVGGVPAKVILGKNFKKNKKNVKYCHLKP